jgi:hypothetical protein
MRTIQRSLAATEILLVLPATLFMTSLFVRNLQPAPFEPAQTARRVVEWFVTKPFIGLDLFLIALPLAAFILGGTAVLRSWRADEELRRAASEMLAAARAHLAMLLIAGATLVSGCVLAIVALHMITE